MTKAIEFATGRAEMMEYLAILEHANDGTWSAYVPDLPGCTSFGPTRDEAETNIRKAVTAHIVGMRETGLVVPEPTSLPELIQIA